MPDFLGLRSSIDGHMGYRNAAVEDVRFHYISPARQ